MNIELKKGYWAWTIANRQINVCVNWTFSLGSGAFLLTSFCKLHQSLEISENLFAYAFQVILWKDHVFLKNRLGPREYTLILSPSFNDTHGIIVGTIIKNTYQIIKSHLYAFGSWRFVLINYNFNYKPSLVYEKKH